MGRSAEAVLAYGYHLGTMEDFKAVERGRFGGPDLPWWPEIDDERESEDIWEAVELRLLEVVGKFADEWVRGDEGYPHRERAARKRIGVRLDSTGHVDYPGMALIVPDSRQQVGWPDAMQLDPNEILIARTDWDVKLAAALDALGIHPTQPAPRWLVYPTYG